MRRALEQLWWRSPEPWWSEALLWPLSLGALAYRAGAALGAKVAQREQVRVGVPVISIGNLGAGGAGKTPIAMHLCELLRACGRRVALLSRGYGRAGNEPLAIACDGGGPLLEAEACGDEPRLIAARCPWLLVLVGSDRVALAHEAVRRGAEIVVLDDGLQHLRLARDLDLIAVDAQRPLGNGRRIPRGPLREDASAFARVGARGLLWFTGASDEPETLGPQARALLAQAVARGVRGPIVSGVVARARPELRGAKVFLLAGIARPERFEASARALGCDVRGRAWFADHHRFSAAELREVGARARAAGASCILTTEKDAARLGSHFDRGPAALPLEALAIELALLQGQELLVAALEELGA